MRKSLLLLLPSALVLLLTSCGEPAPAPGAPALPPAERDENAALAKVNAQLAAAVEAADTAAMDEALSQGANINKANDQGEGLLVIAVRANKPEVVAMLLDRGADPASAMPEGKGKGRPTLLHVAAKSGANDVIPLLVEKGVEVSATYQGNTPLHVAAAQGNTAGVEELLNLGASIDNPGQGGATPIMQAASNGHADTVRKLLEFGAGTNDRDKDDNSALDLARKNGHAEVVAILEEAGAGS